MGSEMTESEGIRAFCNALKKSASAAREMAALLEDASWAETADLLDSMRENGVRLSKMRAMTRIESLQALNLKSGAFKGN